MERTKMPVQTFFPAAAHYSKPISFRRCAKKAPALISGYRAPLPTHEGRQRNMASEFGCMKNGME
jgi:hypothetical protein